MKCLTCDRTLAAGGSTVSMSAGGIEALFAGLLGWTKRADGWICASCDSGSDRQAETAKQAPGEASQSGGEAASPNLDHPLSGQK